MNEIKAKKIVVTCPHCLNTIGREYPDLDGHYEVVHHTQLLAQLLSDKKLIPVKTVDEKVTYHDPCYLGRHNKIYVPPRELVASIPGVKLGNLLTFIFRQKPVRTRRASVLSSLTFGIDTPPQTSAPPNSGLPTCLHSSHTRGQ